MPPSDLTGKEFGKLLVEEIDWERSDNKHIHWICLCSCGNRRSIRSGSLTKKKQGTRSCGCLRSETSTKHGFNGKNLDKVYNGMVARCFHETHKSYPDYGGRGITICKEWLEKTVGRHKFFSWAVSNGYQKGLKLDRFPDNDGPYSPENCRWATLEEQGRNKRNNLLVEVNGEKISLAEAVSKHSKFSYGLVLARVKKGWSIEKAMSTPVKGLHSNKRYFVVTGGLGFLGSCLVDHLLYKFPGHKVIIIDSNTYAADERKIRYERSGYDLYIEDVSNTIKIKEILSSYSGHIDCIFHLAAESMVDRSISNPSKFISSNITGTFSILEMSTKLNIPMIYQSTDEVFGSLGPQESPWNEQSWLNPRNPYSATKASGEFLCNAYRNTFGTKIKIFRSCNVYGTRQNIEKLIPKSIELALKGEPIKLYPDGLQSREWVYQDDFVRAIVAVYEDQWSDEIRYNIFSSSGEVTNRGICERILSQVSGVEREFKEWEEMGKVEFVDPRPGHDSRYAMTGGRLRGLGWKPEVSLEEGLRRTIESCN